MSSLLRKPVQGEPGFPPSLFRRCGRRWLFLSFCLLAASAGAAGLAAGPGKADDPLTSKHVDEIESSLVILDVRVHDKQGKPVRGLVREDFEIFVDGHHWPIEAVDDLCNCGDPGSPDRKRREGLPATLNTAEEITREQERQSFLFVIFLDFKQLDTRRRFAAVADAQLWVQDTMGPGDRAMVYASGRYLKRLAPLGVGREDVLAALDRALEDQDLFDDFPSFRSIRLRACSSCIRGCATLGIRDCSGHCFGDCELNAIYERQHIEQALTILELVLAELEEIPGPKHMLYFNGSGEFFPHRMYPGSVEFTVGDTIRATERSGAAAVAARTAIFAPRWGWSDLVANLADFSGGGKLENLEQEVLRGCSCVYRLAFKRRARKGSVQQVRVRIPRLHRTMLFRTLTPTKAQRWRQRVQRALLLPHTTRAIPAGVSLVPTAPEGRRWRVAVELAFDLDSLETVTEADGRHAEWGAGVYLTRDGGRQSWALENFAKARIAKEDPTGMRVLHRTVLELRPGEYEALAWVGDVAASVFGGAASKLHIPSPKKPAIIGPILLRSSAELLLLPLPEEGSSSAQEDASVPRRMPSPLEAGDLKAGTRVFALSWICTAGAELAAGDLRRYLSRNGVPIFRLEGPPPRRSSDSSCYAISDQFIVPPSGDDQDIFLYHVSWSQGSLAGETPLTAVSAGAVTLLPR